MEERGGTNEGANEKGRGREYEIVEIIFHCELGMIFEREKEREEEKCRLEGGGKEERSADDRQMNGREVKTVSSGNMNDGGEPKVTKYG